MRGGRRRTSAVLTFGSSWLGRRWADVVEAVPGTTAYRLDRGRAFARQGAVTEFEVAAGRLTAVVRDRTALDVTIDVPVLADDAWERAVGALTSELRHGAELASGRVTADVERVVGAAGVELLPEPDALVPACPCQDEVAWCKHATALGYRMADEVDADAFLYVALRGRTREQLVGELRAVRSGGSLDDDRGGQALADLDPATFERARGDLHAVVVHPAPAEEPANLLHRLGPPPDLADLRHLEPLVVRAADAAWRLAAGQGSDVADDEVLLAELRARRMAGAAEVAAGVGWDVERATEALDRLFEEGVVMRTGKGERARYRA